MTHKPLKVGFDLDGVLLYNPVRIVRPLISLLKRKKIGIQRKELEFYVPKPGPEQIMWELFHKSSAFLAPGFGQIEELRAQKLITPYLITGRFGHLQQDFDKWKQKMRADELFEGCYMNGQDEQPHLFKERMIKELKLDVFIEDNWDIVRYLDKNCCHQQRKNYYKTQVIWVSNLLDYKIEYHSKAISFKKALTLINLP
jgi:hypothetical protein